MALVSRDVSVPYSQREMFDLVHDIERYPEFLPWCDGATVLTRNGDEVTAKLLLSRAGVQSRFSTRNKATETRQIDIELLDGPFEYLRGRWGFGARSDQTRVSLELRYRFSNPVMGFLFAGVVEDVATDLVQAFVGRADDVYA